MPNPMESEVWSQSFDGQEDVFDLVRIAIAFASTARGEGPGEGPRGRPQVALSGL